MTKEEPIEEGTLKPGEVHPMAYSALAWFREWSLNLQQYAMTREAIASTALSGNRTAQVLNSTLDRLEKGEAVSDRYLFGLVWYLREARYMEVVDGGQEKQPQKS